MRHNLEVKRQVLKLLNEGYYITEIAKQTGVTHKTISGWRNKWKALDQPKIEVLDRLWKELKDLSKKPLENASKMKTLSATFNTLKKELLIDNKYNEL